jgi:hypothetical protein
MAYQPKSYKKFVATAATATLVASAVVPVAFAAKPATEFSDVAPQYKDAVDYLVDNTIAAGKTPSTFGTAENIIRVDAAIWIAKATLTEGEISAAPASDFTDVPDRGVIYVDALKSKGYVNGTDATSFNSYANISRGEVAMILAEAYDITGNTADNKFTDVNSRYLAAVSALKDNGITSGKSSTRFGTGDAITRGELAIWVYKLETLNESTVSNLNVAVEGSKATVTADVKNVVDNTDATVSVYPNGNLSATPIVNSAKVVGGKVTTAFNDVPAGTHTVVVKVGEAEASKSFVIAATVTPKVESVTAINAKEIQITFNQAIKESSVIDSSDDLIAGIVALNSLDARTLTDNAYLSADGKTLTLVATNTWSGSYAFELVKDKVEATNGSKVGEYKQFVTVSDSVRPTFTGLSYEPSGSAKFSFSEPLNETAASIASKLVVSGGTTVVITATDITLAADNKSFTVALPTSMTKDASYTFTYTGLQDFAGNLLSPNPLSATVVKADRDITKPTVTNVAALDTGKLQVTFSEKIRANTAVVTVSNVDYPTYTLDTTGTIATFTGVTGLTEGVQSVLVKEALDLAGLKMDNVTRVIQVTADSTAPAYVSHTVDTVGGNRFLVVNYNEEITANQAAIVTGTYVDSNNITYTMAPITGLDISTGTDKKSVRIKLPTTVGTYTVNLPAKLAEDTSAATNDSAARNVSFTLGTAVDATKPVTTNFVQNGNKVTVTFDRDVTSATALNVNNYSIEGISSPFESAIFKGNARTVELTVKNDVITTNGVRNYTVSNVATSAGSVMLSETSTYNFDENVRPTVQSAKVISSTEIEVTLNEALDSTTVGTDFDVFQGSSTTAITDVEAISGTNKVVITVAPLTSLSGLTLKASSTINLTDLNGNNVNFVGPIAVTN